MDTRLLAFVGVAALLTITPGADMALVTRTALGRGQRASFLTSLGIVSGLLCWGLASGVGLAALFTASATAFTVLKVAGATYLVILGLLTLWGIRPGAPPAAAGHARGLPARGGRSAYAQGLLNNLLNPKIGVFYTTFLPQFIGPGDAVLARSLLLAGIHALLGLLWLIGYAHAVARAGDLLRRPAARRVLDGLTGLVLVGLGIRLAFQER